ncbi:nitroreductase family deazaflavin-dependent oxidoreductase [Georgenia thermotolerans]|nr:nitroreductase family deazaflavin-dependent oxidoreductase [Georgenia thermotolerans]
MSPIPLWVGRLNKRALNRVMRFAAPHLPGFALLVHRGRRSGREYAVPVNIFRHDAGYRIALTYGRRTDWVRNVLAAGGCRVRTRGRWVELTNPRLVHDPGRTWAPPVVRQILGLTRTPDSLVLDVAAGGRGMRVRRAAVLRGRRDDPARVWWDARRAHRQGREAVQERQRARLAELVRYARRHSAYYRERYQDLPERVDDVTSLPVTNKRDLMARFDEVVTDPAVTRESVQAFVEDPDRIGERFAGRYLVATTAGTTGHRGIFVLDDRYWSVMSGLMGVLAPRWLSWRDLVRMLGRRRHVAGVVATGGHFLSISAATREKREKPRRHRSLRVFPVHTPVPRLVRQLNGFDPILLGGYASVLRLLATEQAAGRLHLRPMLVLSTAEDLPPAEHTRLQRAFGAKVREVYGCTESGYVAYSCAEGWLHLLDDWVIVEPVDADHRPVPPGVVSHTVLMTNLATRVQPILRYDVGDRVLVRPDPCACGDPAPALRVHGRSADVLTFPAAGATGASVTVSPLALGAVLDGTPGVELFQIVQATPTSLRLRLHQAGGADPDAVRAAALAGIRAVLTDLGLSHVTVEPDPDPPEQSAGGKYRTVIPLVAR